MPAGRGQPALKMTGFDNAFQTRLGLAKVSEVRGGL
jgi:hypothetical protein